MDERADMVCARLIPLMAKTGNLLLPKTISTGTRIRGGRLVALVVLFVVVAGVHRKGTITLDEGGMNLKIPLRYPPALEVIRGPQDRQDQLLQSLLSSWATKLSARKSDAFHGAVKGIQ
jgi:hypothetical protein